jgi:predicted phosphodiesterase
MRTAVIADIHGNSPALRAVLEDVRSCRCEQLLFLGDVINGPDPRGSLELLLGWPGVQSIKGNAEWYLCTEGLEEFPWRDRAAYRWFITALVDWRTAIGPQLLSRVSAWPSEMVHGDAWMLHSSPLDLANAGTGPVELPQRYRLLTAHGNGLVPSSPVSVMAANAEAVLKRGFSRLFCGHTHMPFTVHVGEVTILNPGSAGMPLDGDPRASWMLWDGPAVQVRRVAYDIDATLELVARHIRDPERRRQYEWMFPRALHWRNMT